MRQQRRSSRRDFTESTYTAAEDAMDATVMKEDAREDAERATAVADVTRFLDKLGMTGTSSE